jgi:hypothetical protein
VRRALSSRSAASNRLVLRASEIIVSSVHQPARLCLAGAVACPEDIAWVIPITAIPCCIAQTNAGFWESVLSFKKPGFMHQGAVNGGRRQTRSRIFANR